MLRGFFDILFHAWGQIFSELMVAKFSFPRIVFNSGMGLPMLREMSIYSKT